MCSNASDILTILETASNKSTKNVPFSQSNQLVIKGKLILSRLSGWLSNEIVKRSIEEIWKLQSQRNLKSKKLPWAQNRFAFAGQFLMCPKNCQSSFVNDLNSVFYFISAIAFISIWKQA